MTQFDFTAAIRFHTQGNLQEAERIYRGLLAQGDASPAVAKNLAILLQQQERAPEAILLFREVVRQLPNLAEAHYELGTAIAIGTPDALNDAIASFRRAIACDPAHHLAHFNLGVALQTQGATDDAIAAFQTVLRLRPDYHQTHRHLGLALWRQGRLSDAIPALQRAVQALPRDHEAHLLLGRLLYEAGQYADAITALQRAQQLQPDQADTYIVLGEALRAHLRYDDAIASFKRAMELDPRAYTARSDLGVTYCDQGRIDDAVTVLESAMALAPQEPIVYSNFIYTISTTQFFPPEKILALSRGFDRVRKTDFPARAIGTGGKIRVGFISAEIGNHAVSYFLESYLRHYDRNRIHLTLYSTLARFEPRADMLMDLADTAFDVSGLNDDDLRRQIMDDGPDILIDTTSHMNGSRLRTLARRCAPIQCHYIGFNGSTGVGAIDYFIGDPEVTPAEFAAHYAEKIVRLPRIWMAYAPPADAPAPQNMGPSDVLTLGCFNNLAKVRAETLSVWAQVMTAVPQSRLLLKDRMCADPYSRDRISGFLAARGIASDRIEYIDRTPGWREHMALYNRVDIALDTLPLNSGTTGFDALYMATPLVAMRGNWMGARMSSAMLKALGHPEWIAETAADYVRIVRALASDRRRLAGYKQTLRDEMLRSPLCDGKGIARDLEAAFVQMIADKNAAQD
jgi:predicted O-linked N-acetylglucosamine transferase (SPINDLY family)